LILYFLTKSIVFGNPFAMSRNFLNFSDPRASSTPDVSGEKGWIDNQVTLSAIIFATSSLIR